MAGRSSKVLPLIIFLALFLTACTVPENPDQPPLHPTFTLTPKPTETPDPTNTPEPTFTPTPEPDPWAGYGVNDIGWIQKNEQWQKDFESMTFNQELFEAMGQFRKDSISQLAETNPGLFDTITSRLVASRIVNEQGSRDGYIEEIQKFDWTDTMSMIMIHNQETQEATILTVDDIKIMEQTPLPPYHLWLDEPREGEEWYGWQGGGWVQTVDKPAIISKFQSVHYSINLFNNPDVQRQDYASYQTNGDYYGYTKLNTSQGEMLGLILRIKDKKGEAGFKIYAIATHPYEMNEKNKCFANLSITACPVKSIQTRYRDVSIQSTQRKPVFVSENDLISWLSKKGPRVTVVAAEQNFDQGRVQGFIIKEGLQIVDLLDINLEERAKNSP